MILEIVLFLIVGIGLGLIYWIKKKRLSFPTTLILAFLVGLATGAIILFVSPMVSSAVVKDTFVYSGVDFLRQLFVTLMQMMILPLVFFSILNVVIAQQIKSRKAMFGIIGGFVLMVTIGLILGTTLASITGLGTNLNLEVPASELEALSKYTSAVSSYGFFTLLASFIPSNIIKAMSDNNIIAVILFVALLGTGINRAKKRYAEEISVVTKFVNGIYHGLSYMMRSILLLLPYSIFAMMIRLLVARDFKSLTTLAVYTAVIFAAMALAFIIQMTMLLIQGISPIQYIKNVLPTLIVAFSTSSSNATLPVNITTLQERAGVSKPNATLVPTLATSMGMIACAGIFPSVLAIMTLHSLGMDVTVTKVGLILMFGILGSFGVQGIPGTATIAATFLLTSLGLPLGAIVFVAPIDFFVDMFRTTLNVNGGMIVALSADKMQGTWDEKVFKEDSKVKNMEND